MEDTEVELGLRVRTCDGFYGVVSSHVGRATSAGLSFWLVRDKEGYSIGCYVSKELTRETQDD